MIRHNFYIILGILFLQAVANPLHASDIVSNYFASDDGWVTKSYGDWVIDLPNGEQWQAAGVNISATNNYLTSYGVGFNDVNDWIELPPVNNPDVLTFYARLSSVGVAASNKLMVQRFDENMSTWIDIQEIEQSVNTFEQFSINIHYAGQNVRLRIARTADEKSHYVDAIVVSDFFPWDADSEISVPTTQIAAANIPANWDTEAEAFEVMSFIIKDLGTSDGKATTIKKLHFKPTISNTAQWSKNIQQLKLSNGVDIPISSFTILDTEIELFFEDGVLIIPDGTSMELTLSMVLNSSNVVDGEILGLKINATEHACEAFSTTSMFTSDFGMDISSNQFIIDVQTFRLNHVSTPIEVPVNYPFSIKISATDENGNIDKDANFTVSLHVKTGVGNLSSAASLSRNLVNGQLEWNDLQYDQEGEFTIAINADELTESVSNTILSSDYYLYVDNDFTSDQLNEWFNTDDWIWTNDRAIQDYSLKHNLTNVSGTSYTSRLLHDLPLDAGITTWRFQLKNDWGGVPSSSNNFGFVLMSDRENLLDENLNAYLVGVHVTGSDNYLTLWKITNGEY